MREALVSPNFDIVFGSIIYHGQPSEHIRALWWPDTRNLYAYQGNLLPLMALTLGRLKYIGESHALKKTYQHINLAIQNGGIML